MKRNKKQKRRTSNCIFPGYRWCGPGCSGPGAPLNAVDACCKMHDRCLGQGVPTCRCDSEFMNCLRSRRHKFSDEGKTAAIIYQIMKLKTLFTC
ncbi:phospholipase [Peribacillus saganii]|uniref:Phospholipase n=1 Tax=Peribacillus saganii TaxID=2303992 RepID=A0A372LEU2_9BACI|nr:phospholipase [Peribacillus saganii]